MARSKTADDLEWSRLQSALLDRCLGPSAKARGLTLATTFEGTVAALAETEEAMRLAQAGEPLPLDGLRDVRAHLQRLDRHGALDGPALADVWAVLGLGRRLSRFLAARRQQAPALAMACTIDPSLRSLEEELAFSIEADGTVADRASPALKNLREEVANLRGRIVGRLEQLMQQHESILQDRYYTLREGRFVLPVRRDAHERMPGIVHGTSASGASVFVEPRSIVVLGNRFKMAQGELERELTRILSALSDHVRERIHEVDACAAAVDHADLRQASARLGMDLRGVVPELLNAPRMRLLEARHPLLVLEGAQVVPNRLELAGGEGLVISGPNAGGKTVALKTLGLAAWMVRGGLPLPVAEGSQCGFFEAVLTDVGDEQSTLRNLSTFSAHMTNIAHIIHHAGPSSMVLLDELAGGTDPEEGAALACAIVDALCRAGAAVAVTTHYEPLKAFALTDARLRNASVGFDVERMEPTFELMLDVPGASSALAVAQRFGLPEDIIGFARRVLPEQSRDFERLTRELTRLAEELQRERRDVADARIQLEAAQREVDARLRAAAEMGRERVAREVQNLLSRVREARAQVEEARASLRRATPTPTPEDVMEADRLVRAAAATVTLGGEVDKLLHETSEPQALPPPAVALGARVYVPRLRSEGTVIEGPRKARVRLAVGAMKLWVDIAELRAPSESASHPPPEAPDTEPDQESQLPIQRSEVRTSDNTLDLRGMRVDDALGMLETFLDRLYGRSESVGYVLHGHGTGALREAVRRQLASASRCVVRVRPGDDAEGGDAVTVCYLR